MRDESDRPTYFTIIPNSSLRVSIFQFSDCFLRNGALFGGISYSAVAKIYQNFSRLMADDKELQGRMKKLLEDISTFKTPKSLVN